MSSPSLLTPLAAVWARWTAPREPAIVPAAMPADETLPVYWTPSRVAQELGVHRQTVHDWMAAGKLTPVATAYETRERIVYLFDPDDVREVARQIPS